MDEVGQLVHPLSVYVRDGRVAAHAAGVRPLVAVEDPLVVLRGSERHDVLAVAEGQEGQLLAVEEVLKHYLGLAKALLAEEHVHRFARFGFVLTDDHALTCGQAVGFEDHRVIGARHSVQSLLRAAKDHVACSGHSGSVHQLLCVDLGPLESSRPRRWGRKPGCPRPRANRRPLHERRLWPDDHEVDAF